MRSIGVVTSLGMRVIVGSNPTTYTILPCRLTGRTLGFEPRYTGSNPVRATVLVAYLVKVSDCESGEQGSIPANTQIP